MKAVHPSPLQLEKDADISAILEVRNAVNRKVIFLVLAAALFAGCSSPGGIPSNGQLAPLSTTGGAQDDNLTYA